MMSIDEINELKKIIDCKNGTIAVLKDSNTKIQEAYKKLNSLYFDNCEYTGRLERVLEKIKEIARKFVFLSSDISTLKGDIGQLQNEVAVAILQIISDCEGENE